jgi:hypothetical protein
MPSFNDVALFVVFGVLIAIGVWALYTIVKNAPMEKEDGDGAIPYKVDPPANTNDFFHEPEIQIVAGSDNFEPYCAPKRNYTKRSSYWINKRKKAAAKKRKAKQTGRR